MLSSVAAIFANFIDKPKRFDIYSIESQRGQNPEDIFYLCNIKDKYYVVYETDYIGELSFVVKEAADIFSVKPLHWLVKKDAQEAMGATLKTTIADDDKSARQALIAKGETYLRYAALEVEVADSPNKRYNPNTYSFTESYPSTEHKDTS